MTSPDMAELAQRGRAFREEVFTDDFLATAGGHLTEASDAVVGQYSLTKQFHVTHGLNIAAIQEHGLAAGVQLFDREDELFFREAYTAQQRRRRDYNDDTVVEKYIFGVDHNGAPRGAYTTGELDDYHIRTFAIPERTKFMLRNLHHLSKLGEVSHETRERAADLAAKYSGRLTTNGAIDVGVFAVDAKSPQLAKAILAPYNFEGVDDDFAVSTIGFEQRNTMVQLRSGVPAEFVELQERHSIGATEYFREVFASNGQVVFRPVGSSPRL